MAKENKNSNLTVRLDGKMLARLESLEASVRRTRTDIVRQTLDAVLTQFEKTGSIQFPLRLESPEMQLDDKTLARLKAVEVDFLDTPEIVHGAIEAVLKHFEEVGRAYFPIRIATKEDPDALKEAAQIIADSPPKALIAAIVDELQKRFGETKTAFLEGVDAAHQS